MEDCLRTAWRSARLDRETLRCDCVEPAVEASDFIFWRLSMATNLASGSGCGEYTVSAASASSRLA